MKIHELGHVVLYVQNIKKSADFYRDTLGFTELFREGPLAAFSSGRTHHELLLIEVGTNKEPRTHIEPGLYHIGFKIGHGHTAIQAVWNELKEKGIHIVGTGDHTITQSIYILDPDGNELELYADMSDDWKRDPNVLLTPTKRLDLE